jgi:hypothetical protein
MFLFSSCCTKLKLQAKEKITEAATEESRLFAPLEQVDQHVACFQVLVLGWFISFTNASAV